MADASLSIGDVARAVGVAPSALRYYDEIGLVRPAARVSGRRRYDETAVARLRIVAQCQHAGFSLDEIRGLLDGDGDWQALARRKLADLDRQIAALLSAQRLIRGALACGCAHLERCGRATHTPPAEGICGEHADAGGSIAGPGAHGLTPAGRSGAAGTGCEGPRGA